MPDRTQGCYGDVYDTTHRVNAKAYRRIHYAYDPIHYSAPDVDRGIDHIFTKINCGVEYFIGKTGDYIPKQPSSFDIFIDWQCANSSNQTLIVSQRR